MTPTSHGLVARWAQPAEVPALCVLEVPYARNPLSESDLVALRDDPEALVALVERWSRPAGYGVFRLSCMSHGNGTHTTYARLELTVERLVIARAYRRQRAASFLVRSVQEFAFTKLIGHAALAIVESRALVPERSLDVSLFFHALGWVGELAPGAFDRRAADGVLHDEDGILFESVRRKKQ